MARWNAITQEQIQEMEALHAQGLNNVEIAKKIGVSHNAVQRHISNPGFRVDDKMIEDMKVYRELGLSNRKIAIEMGISYETVRRKLGNQPTGTRSEYGSIVAHTTGDSFVHQDITPATKKEENLMAKTIGTALELVSNTVEFKGKIGYYTIDMCNGITVKSASNQDKGLNFLIPCQLSDLIAELQELQTFFDTQRN